MLRAFGLVLLALAGMTYGARAQVVDVPKTYPIPLPPLSNPEPQWDLGMRYWWSEGNSTLTSEDAEADALEFVWGVRNEARTFFKGFVGGGWFNSGSDEVGLRDYATQLDGEGMVYGTMDVGQDFKLVDTGTRVVFSPFVGFNYWEETFEGFGARCVTDTFYSAPCTPGDVFVPFSDHVLSGEVAWSSLRLGAELTAKFWDRLTLRADAALLPVAYLTTDMRNTGPRYQGGSARATGDDASGWGYQLEGEIRLDVTESWAVGGGVRYWYAETYGDRNNIDFGVAEVSDFSSERFGVFGNVTYRFATY